MRLHELFDNETVVMKYGNHRENILMGIECEVESVRALTVPVEAWFKIDTDGSLRNEGKEFISRPMFSKDILNAFNTLHQHLVPYPEWPAFSERTSIHVHVNCTDMQDTEVRQAVLLYALFEEFFFMFCEPERRNNIHCVALNETPLPNHYGQHLKYLYSRWHKYTALNIKPLATYGTIEFRHMHGHSDAVLLQEWLTVLENLMKLAKTSPLNSATLNRENLLIWFDTIFGQSRISRMRSSVLETTKNTVLDVKLGVM